MLSRFMMEQTALGLLRAQAGLSRDKAAVILGMAPNTLLRYEHGKNDIGLSVLERMASLYGVSFDEICNAARNVRKFPVVNKFENIKIQEERPQ